MAVVEHRVRPGLTDVAEARIRANGDTMARIPGFVERRLLHEFDDAGDRPVVLVTITTWESRHGHATWLVARRTEPEGPGEYPYLEPPSTRTYTELPPMRAGER